ncbi:cysteine-rich receptor-like protein kinase 43 [Lactuca sativa]|uniref:cysteine-rich receptor-like protein kinase 43 n=1 Tax=Lactuca sativa TaxID=4236 RepID=UPI000CA78C52|nr:cysteine-rich receptor-like protein kinase 43 [Lactuca sativa]
MTKSNSFFHNLVKRFKLSSSKESQEEELEAIAAQEQKIFSFQTLVSATKNFHPDNKLGQGGYGPVFKGKLDDGREIAVKKLSQTSTQGKKEFTTEAKLLARVQHRNVVNLLGFCGYPEKLLVYEYVVHESLDKLLFSSGNRKALDWKRRYNIIVGVARGLLYLHEDSHDRIIHRDIKASNILLDDKWIPKIADFGMARLYPEDQTHINTRVAGTNGYMAPEYVMHGNLSVKVDVYSFGVMVLELVSGQKNSAFNLDPECENLLDWAYKLYKKGKSLEILESKLYSSSDLDEVSACIKIGLLCTQSDPGQRPTMRRVVVMLTKKSGVLDEPSRPGIPGTRYRRSRRPGTSGGSSSHSSTTTTTTTTTITTSTAPTTASGPSGSVPRRRSSSSGISSRSDPHGKRPMMETYD